jgi:hypothetical protein
MSSSRKPVVNSFCSSSDEDFGFGEIPELNDSPRGSQKIRVGESITSRASA